MNALRIALFLGTLMLTPLVCGWDAGPRTCRHNECSGGVVADKVLDTQPRWASSVLPTPSCPAGKEFYGGVCYNACEAGWSRTAVCTCKKNGGGIFDLKTDCGRFGASGVPTAGCPAGRELWGGLCYAACPPGSVRSAVSTCVHNVKWRSNTHLWIVNRAIDLLARSGDQPAIKAATVMNSQTCRVQWEGGLWDADDGDLSETGGAYGSHFYNGAGLDFFGKATKVVTYVKLGAEQNARGTARANAKKNIDTVGHLTTPEQCRSLGIALHYLTDMTQPMHSSSYSALELPLSMHAAFEDYVGNVQARFPSVSMAWTRDWTNASADEVFHQVAVKGNSMAPGLSRILTSTGPICTMTTESGNPPVTYTGKCYVNDPEVIAKIGEILAAAYQSTASYLYAALRTI